LDGEDDVVGALRPTGGLSQPGRAHPAECDRRAGCHQRGTAAPASRLPRSAVVACCRSRARLEAAVRPGVASRVLRAPYLRRTGALRAAIHRERIPVCR
jgi:hypothetical protein